MSIQLAADIWGLVREAIPYDDRSQLADSLVDLLLNDGYDLDDITYAFDGDPDVQDVIKYHADDGDYDDISDDIDDIDDDQWTD
jgi:hypothetical protein